jgi:hypothetical protein
MTLSAWEKKMVHLLQTIAERNRYLFGEESKVGKIRDINFLNGVS